MSRNDKTKASGEESKSSKSRSLLVGGILVATVIAVTVWWSGSSLTPSRPEPASKWKTFVSVEGQPESVPAEWVATAEGSFAHSIKLPEPLPGDSGYREGMTSKEYWEHLCTTEAGEFIYKTVDSVDGFNFMRPPERPSDDDMKDRYILEAPDLERIYLFEPEPERRTRVFVNPPWRLFGYVEEPNLITDEDRDYLLMLGYIQDGQPMQTIARSERKSSYGFTWRGVRRPHDRALAIAGSEWIVLDLASKQVLAMHRDFAISRPTPKTPQGIWWLNAVGCPNVIKGQPDSGKIYDFVAKVLRPNFDETAK